MSRLNYESVVEMLKEAISSKNRSVNLEVGVLSRSGYTDDIIGRAQYLTKLVAGRDALLKLLHDVEDKDEGV